MLEVLIRHAGQVLSREQLLSHVWGYDYDPGSNVVDVYVGYLRKKLGSGAIETVRGMGYRLVTREDTAHLTGSRLAHRLAARTGGMRRRAGALFVLALVAAVVPGASGAATDEQRLVPAGSGPGLRLVEAGGERHVVRRAPRVRARCPGGARAT